MLADRVTTGLAAGLATTSLQQRTEPKQSEATGRPPAWGRVAWVSWVVVCGDRASEMHMCMRKW